MKKWDFLKLLKKEGRLKFVEPSEEIKQSYLQKSLSYMDSAKLLFKNRKLEEAISMIYYSMYYSLLALLFKVGIKSENHTASILLLKELFNLNNTKILNAKKERIDKQYYINFEIAENDVKNLIQNAEEFNAMIFDYLEKLTMEEINEIRSKLKKLLKKH